MMMMMTMMISLSLSDYISLSDGDLIAVAYQGITYLLEARGGDGTVGAGVHVVAITVHPVSKKASSTAAVPSVAAAAAAAVVATVLPLDTIRQSAAARSSATHQKS